MNFTERLPMLAGYFRLLGIYSLDPVGLLVGRAVFGSNQTKIREL
jgi:hypothetical protein